MATVKLNLNKGDKHNSKNDKEAEKIDFEPIVNERATETSTLSQNDTSTLPKISTDTGEDGINQLSKNEDTEPKDEDIKPKSNQKKRSKKSKKGRGTFFGSKSKTSNKPQSAEQAYKEYKTRKRVVFITIIVGFCAILFFGFYNTFLKQEMTPEEAALYTNVYNGQMQNQKWDSGIQSYLAANLKTLLQSKFITNSVARTFDVSDISVERNQPVSDTMFLTFFDCTVTVNGEPKTLFCYIFISTANAKMQAASDVTITARQSYTASAEKTAKNAVADFGTGDIDTDKSASFQPVLDNFLTLGYNLHQDTSNIYKGSIALNWQGTYQGITVCNVYKTTNQLGFNAMASYVIEEDNGFKYTNTCYLLVEQQDKDTWIISQIM